MRETVMTRRELLSSTSALAISVLAGCSAEPGIDEGSRPVKLERTGSPMTNVQPSPGKEIATLAGGCFWCTEAIFTELKGVESVLPGYAGGQVANPTYEQVCSGTTGHAEAIQVVFDPKVISYHDILAIFLSTHDPTTLNRQGPDAGTQYRPGTLYHTPGHNRVAEHTTST